MGQRLDGRAVDVVLVVPPVPGAALTAPSGGEPPPATLLRAAVRQGAVLESLRVLVPEAERDRAAEVLGPGPTLLAYAPGALHDTLGRALAVPPGEEPRAALVALADVVTSGAPLGDLLDDPRSGTGVLVAPATGGTLALERGAVAGPGGTAATLGVLRLDPAARATAARALGGATLHDPVLAVVAALHSAGVPVRAVPLGPFAWARPADAAALTAARAAVAAIDEHAVRLRGVARPDDGVYSTLVLRRISPRLTAAALRLGLTPNGVTLGSVGLGLAAAGLAATGGRPEAAAAAALLQACLLADCVDGELARYRRRFSRFGAWLDATTDRVKEFAVIAALAVAAAPAAGDRIWLLAGAAVTIQTFRHLFDLGWALQREAAAPAPAPLTGSWHDGAAELAAPDVPRTTAGERLRRLGHVPIGERFLLLSLGLAFWTPAGTLAALVVAGTLATGYMLAAFAARSGALRGSAPNPRALALVDLSPPLAGRVRGLRSPRAAALLPAAAAAAELTGVLAVATAAGAPAAGLGLAAASAVALYQRGYRVREDGDPRPRWFGADLRLVAVAAAVLTPAPGVALAGLAALVAAGVVIESAADWRPARRPGTARPWRRSPALAGGPP